MKKILIGFLILIIGVCAFADADVPHLYIGTGNDKFTYGISKNADDQLTYSGDIEFDFDRYILELELNAYTDRGSWPDGEYRNGRLDGIFFDTVFQRNFGINRFLSLNVSRTFGIGMTGHFAFDFIQNFHHRNVGVDPVKIPYDWNTIKVAPMCGFSFALNFDVGKLHYHILTDYKATVFFTSRKRVLAGVSFLDIASFDFGFQANKNSSDSLTMDAVVASQKGLVINVQIEASPVRVMWEYYPNTSFGYGKFYIDAVELFRKAKWMESDIFIDYSISRLYEMELLNAGVRIPLTDSLYYLFDIGYVSGFPKNGDVLNRVQRNYALYEAGVYYAPLKWFVTPYLQAQIGMGYFQVDFMNNVNPEKSPVKESLPAKVVFSSDVRLGFEILPEGFVSFGNTSYRVQIFGGSHFIPGKAKLTDLLRQDMSHSPKWSASLFSPYFGVGISIGIDV